MADEKSTPVATFEEVVDDIYEIVDRVCPKCGLDALTSCILGLVGRCANPHRAMLAVIAEITSMVRFQEVPEEEVLSLDEWIFDAWDEDEMTMEDLPVEGTA